MPGRRYGDAASWLSSADQAVQVVAVAHRSRSSAETRSYLGDGRVVILPRPDPRIGRVAVDAESRDQPVPSHLASSPRFAEEADFWRAWTRFEVCCKLLDRPVATALQDGFEPTSVRSLLLRSFDLEGLAVTVGLRPS